MAVAASVLRMNVFQTNCERAFSAISMLMQVFHEIPSIGVSLASLVLITGLTLWLAGRAAETREYVLEQ